jgi:hypothetical protein
MARTTRASVRSACAVDLAENVLRSARMEDTKRDKEDMKSRRDQADRPTDVKGDVKVPESEIDDLPGKGGSFEKR